MKKYLTKIVIFIIIVLILVGIIYIKNNNYKRPDYGYVAIIYHSEMLGIDAGFEYTYYIYKDNNSNNKNSYFYIKSKSEITITGSQDSKDVKSSSLKKKSDLNKIKLDIKADTHSKSSSVSYYYIDNGQEKKCASIEELGDMLF